MKPDQKRKLGRYLGYFCVVVGTFNLVLAGILALRDATQVAYPLLGSGLGALTGGFIILAVGRRKPSPGE